MSPADIPARPQGSLLRCLARMARGAAMRSALMADRPPEAPHAQALLDAVALFDELGIGYALVGGVAAMYYGRARFTEDVDFVAAAGHAEVLAAHPAAMQSHGFDPACTWKLHHASGTEIDLWKDERADEIVARARAAALAGRSVRIADPHDLIAMKLRSGRLQDDYDISEVLCGTAITDGTVQALVEREQFAHYLDIKRRTQQRP